jgi:Tfp pilus assembly protein PilF
LLKRVRPLDAAIVLVGVAILVVGAYFAYSIWSNNESLRNSSPASREIQALTKALKKKPNDVETRMRLAQALSVNGRSRDAVEQYQEVLKLNKDWVPALSGIGFELLKQKDWKGGEDYFKRVIALTEGKTPDLPGGSSGEIANYYVGIALMEQRDYSGAAGYLKNALRMRRDASDTAYALSVCYAKLGIPDGQREMLQYTLQFDPRMPEANYDYGLMLAADGKPADAAEHFRTSTDAAPYKSEPKVELAKFGSAASRLGKADGLASTDASAALVEARIAAAVNPQSVKAYLLVGQLYEKLNKGAKAKVAYDRVLELDPGNPDATAALKRVKNGS